MLMLAHYNNSYILKPNHEPEPIHDMVAWLRWYEDPTNARLSLVGHNELGSFATVTTCFDGVAQGERDGKPLLFSTVVKYGDDREPSITRYTTWNEASDGHQKVVTKTIDEMLGWEDEDNK